MIDFTPLVRPWFLRRIREAESWRGHVEKVQRKQLTTLLSYGRRTLWGVEKGLEDAWDYDDFRKALPAPIPYSALRPWIMKMIQGEKNILWPGVTMNFAQSSGTSDGKSKYLSLIHI